MRADLFALRILTPSNDDEPIVNDVGAPERNIRLVPVSSTFSTSKESSMASEGERERTTGGE
jgi:hypothetical protein